MANAAGAEKARIGKLKKKAESMGITFQDDVTEEVLKQAIAEAKEGMEDDDEGGRSGLTQKDLLQVAEVIGKTISAGQRDFMLSKDEASEETYAEPSADEIGDMKVYYAPSIWWLLPAKRIAGRLVKAPYGKIRFSLDRGNAVQVGSQWQTRYISIYATDNKKVQAYMETHPLFGRMFFLSSKEAMVTSEQVKYATAFGKHMNALANTHARDLDRRLNELGVQTSHNMSLTTLRTALAEKLAENEVSANEARLRAIMQAQEKATLLTPTQPTP